MKRNAAALSAMSKNRRYCLQLCRLLDELDKRDRTCIFNIEVKYKRIKLGNQYTPILCYFPHYDQITIMFPQAPRIVSYMDVACVYIESPLKLPNTSRVMYRFYGMPNNNFHDVKYVIGYLPHKPLRYIGY